MGSSKNEQTKNNFIESNQIVFFYAESPSTSAEWIEMRSAPS